MMRRATLSRPSRPLGAMTINIVPSTPPAAVSASDTAGNEETDAPTDIINQDRGTWTRASAGLFDLLDEEMERRILRQLDHEDLCSMARTCRRFAEIIRRDDTLWKEACRHRFDDSWLGRREWSTADLHEPDSMPWRSRYRQTARTLNRWRNGTCLHGELAWPLVQAHHPTVARVDELDAVELSGNVLATGDVFGVVNVWSIRPFHDPVAFPDEADEPEPVDGRFPRSPLIHRRKLVGHTDCVSSIVLHCREWNEKGGRILTASDDCTARVWSCETGECLHVLRHPEPTRHIEPIHEPVYLDGASAGLGMDLSVRKRRGERTGSERGGRRLMSWEDVEADAAVRDHSAPAFAFDFRRIVVKIVHGGGPFDEEWPAQSNVESHWFWDLGDRSSSTADSSSSSSDDPKPPSEVLERTFEPCCLSDLILDDRVLAMLIACDGTERRDEDPRTFEVCLRDIDDGAMVGTHSLPPFPGTFGGITKFSLCRAPRIKPPATVGGADGGAEGVNTAVQNAEEPPPPRERESHWNGLLEFADERHLAEFGADADGVPFCTVHTLPDNARFCSMGNPNFSFPIGSDAEGDRLYLVTRDIEPGSRTDRKHWTGAGDVNLRAYCLEGKTPGTRELTRVGGDRGLRVPYDSCLGTANLVAAQVPDPAMTTRLSLVVVDRCGCVRTWTLPEGKVSRRLPRRLRLTQPRREISRNAMQSLETFLSELQRQEAAAGGGGGQVSPEQAIQSLSTEAIAELEGYNEEGDGSLARWVPSGAEWDADPAPEERANPVSGQVAADDGPGRWRLPWVVCHGSWRYLVAFDYGGIQVYDFCEPGEELGGDDGVGLRVMNASY